MFARSKAKVEARIERERERFRSPRTREGANLSFSETILYVAVLAGVVLLASLAPSKMPMIHLAIFSLGVVALSQKGKDRLLPPIYQLLAAKFHWKASFEEASSKEAEARAAERDKDLAAPAGKPDAKQAGPARLDEKGKTVLEVYFAMSQEERREGIDKVLPFFRERGHAFPDLDDAETADERFALGQAALRRLAKQNGVALGGAA